MYMYTVDKCPESSTNTFLLRVILNSQTQGQNNNINTKYITSSIQPVLLFNLSSVEGHVMSDHNSMPAEITTRLPAICLQWYQVIIVYILINFMGSPL